MSRYFGTKNIFYVWDVATVPSYIWDDCTIVNFFGFTSPGNVSFMGFDAKF